MTGDLRQRHTFTIMAASSWLDKLIPYPEDSHLPTLLTPIPTSTNLDSQRIDVQV